MTVTFKYKNKQYTTNNLDKKLSKLGITINDIEILSGKNSPIELEENLDKIKVIVRSNIDDTIRVCFIDKDKPRPTIKELFKHHIWNPITKTGIKEFTEEYLMTLYYDNI